MKELDRVEFTCDECGGNLLATEEHHSDVSDVHCKNCGRRIGTFGELKAKRASNAVDFLIQNAIGQLRRKGPA